MKAKASKKCLIAIAALTAAATALALTSCNSGGSSSQADSSSASSQTSAQTDTTAAETTAASTAAASKKLEESDIKINDTIENSADGEHAITADGETKTISNTLVTKTGEADGDEADFYGENSAVFATNGGTLTLSNMVVKTNGTHANAVFSYGEGTTVNISNSYIETSDQRQLLGRTYDNGRRHHERREPYDHHLGQLVGGYPKRQGRRHRNRHRRRLYHKRQGLTRDLLNG